MAPDRGFRGNGTWQRFSITSGSGPKGMLTLAVAFAAAQVQPECRGLRKSKPRSWDNGGASLGAGGLRCALHNDMRPGVVSSCVCVCVCEIVMTSDLLALV
jgi:hypothetical protein